MTVDEFVREGIDKLMADAAAQATEFTEASGALVLSFMDAADALYAAWRDWLIEQMMEEER